MKYTPIIGTLGFILSKDQQKVLLVHRIANKEDDHLGKYNGLGGKMHATEDVASCMKREIFEESGLVVEDMHLRGILNWTGFGPKEQDWLGFIFLITSYSNEPNLDSPEGPLDWVSIDQIKNLPLWEGDYHFIDLIFDKDPKIFYGHMPYKKNLMQSFEFVRY